MFIFAATFISSIAILQEIEKKERRNIGFSYRRLLLDSCCRAHAASFDRSLLFLMLSLRTSLVLRCLSPPSIASWSYESLLRLPCKAYPSRTSSRPKLLLPSKMYIILFLFFLPPPLCPHPVPSTGRGSRECRLSFPTLAGAGVCIGVIWTPLWAFSVCSFPWVSCPCMIEER